MLNSTGTRGGLRRVTLVFAASLLTIPCSMLVASNRPDGGWHGRSNTSGRPLPQVRPTPVQKQEAKDQKQQDQKAQDQKQQQEDTIHLSSRLVLVPVSASDASGRPVKDLKVQDIVIEEEGKPQQVVALGEPGKTPIDLALLFDVSGSTQKQFDFEQQAAVQFIKEDLKPNDAISLFSIGLTPKMVRARTANAQEAVGGLMSITPVNEPTAFFDAVVEAVDYLDKAADSGSRRVVLVISDGEENYSKQSTLSDALRDLQKNDCLFYSINPNGEGASMNKISREGQSVMEAMATQTGGKAFTASKTEALGAVFRQIAEELQAQYLFGYYTTDEKSGGGFKRITVTAPKRPDLRIRARQGYYVRGTAE